MKVEGIEKGVKDLWTPRERESQEKVKGIQNGLSLRERENGFSKGNFKDKAPREIERLRDLEKLTEELKRLRENLQERIREFLERNDLSLRYLLDQKTGTLLAQLVERKSGKVIRQIPSEEALRIKEILEGFLSDSEEPR
jgi:uncharacterized FlaG/YvyC family protein